MEHLKITAGPYTFIARLEKEMKEAAKMLEFECAAILRDRLIELRKSK